VKSSTISLDQLLAGPGTITLGDRIAEADGLAASLGQAFDLFAEIEQRLDLTQALGRLPPADLKLCIRLTECTPTEISRFGKPSRASLYRQLERIRGRLMREGVTQS
jgi:hypothetical protein